MSDSEDDDVNSGNELANYQQEKSIPVDDDPLHWWCSRASSYKKLKPIAFKYLSTPATTMPCERLFSLAENVVSRRRASLNPTSENTYQIVHKYEINRLITMQGFSLGLEKCFRTYIINMKHSHHLSIVFFVFSLVFVFLAVYCMFIVMSNFCLICTA